MSYHKSIAVDGPSGGGESPRWPSGWPGGWALSMSIPGRSIRTVGLLAYRQGGPRGRGGFSDRSAGRLDIRLTYEQRTGYSICTWAARM